MNNNDLEWAAQYLDTICECISNYIALAASPDVRPGSPAFNDFRSGDRTASGEEWGPETAETYGALLLLTAFAVADHLASLAALLRTDGEMGVPVMARTVSEAAGRICFMLPFSEVDGFGGFRERYGRSQALRLRGARDQKRNLEELADGPGKGDSEVEAAAKAAELRAEEILNDMSNLGFKITNDGNGLADLSAPSSSMLGALGIALPAGFGSAMYSSWSGAVHSTYDWLRNHLQIVGQKSRAGVVQTSPASRVQAACYAAHAAVTALDRLISYFGLDPEIRLAMLETDLLTELLDRSLQHDQL